MDKNKNEDIGKQKNHLGKEIITNLRWIGKRCGEFLLKISQDDYENPSPAPKVELSHGILVIIRPRQTHCMVLAKMMI